MQLRTVLSSLNFPVAKGGGAAVVNDGQADEASQRQLSNISCGHYDAHL